VVNIFISEYYSYRVVINSNVITVSIHEYTRPDRDNYARKYAMTLFDQSSIETIMIEAIETYIEDEEITNLIGCDMIGVPVDANTYIFTQVN